MCLCPTPDHFKSHHKKKKTTCFDIVKIMWHVVSVSIYSGFRHILSSTHRVTQGLEGGRVDTEWWEVEEEEEVEQQCGDHQRRQGLNSKTQPELPVWSSHKCGSSTPQRLEFIPLCIISSGWWATRWIKLIHIHWRENTELWQVLQPLAARAAIKPPSLKFLQTHLQM